VEREDQSEFTMRTTKHFFAALTILAAIVQFSDVRAEAEASSALPTNSIESQECTSLAEAPAYQTPVDLYRMVTRCAAGGQHETALIYFALAGVYGRYDTYRVADVSAHQIVGILKSAALNGLPPARKAEFQRIAGQAYNDGAKHQALCERVKTLGRPKYFPVYMVNHGLDTIIYALREDASSSAPPYPLVSPFDADSAWLKATSSYLQCQ
jgi:hypothetical protein